MAKKKRGAQFNKSFKMRYFRMERKQQHTFLCYYTDPSEGPCAGQIELSKCILRHNDAEKPLEFLLSSGERQFILQASSLKDKAIWMESLSPFTRQLPTEGTSGVPNVLPLSPTASTTQPDFVSFNSDSSIVTLPRRPSLCDRPPTLERRLSLQSLKENLSNLGLQDHMIGSEKNRPDNKITAVYRSKKKLW